MTSNNGVIEFRDDDHAYLAWARGHQVGWVVNTSRKPKANYLQLHKAWCPTISDDRRQGAYTEGEYIKFCAVRRAALNEYFLSELGTKPAWNCTRCG